MGAAKQYLGQLLCTSSNAGWLAAGDPQYCDTNLGEAFAQWRHRSRGLGDIAGPNQVDVEISWPMIGLNNATSAAVRDLWLHKDLGSFMGSFKASVGSHDVFVARITTQI